MLGIVGARIGSHCFRTNVHPIEITPTKGFILFTNRDHMPDCIEKRVWVLSHIFYINLGRTINIVIYNGDINRLAGRS